MPLYEYQCDACAHRFEKIQKFSDPHEDTCPKCGGAVKKLVSSPAIQFKGSGFYINDYAKKPSDSSRKPSSDKDNSGKSESAKGDSSKSDGSKSDGSKSDAAKGDSSSSRESSSSKTTDSTPSSSSSNSSSSNSSKE